MANLQVLESKADNLLREICDYLDSIDMNSFDIKNKIVQYGNYCTGIGMQEERDIRDN